MKEIRINNDTKIAYGKYVGFVPLEEFIESAELHLDQIKIGRVQKFLLDLREFSVMPPGATEYISSKWYPKANNIGLRLMAFLTPRSTITKMSVDRAIQVVGNVKVKYFEDLAEANDWLMRESIFNDA